MKTLNKSEWKKITPKVKWIEGDSSRSYSTEEVIEKLKVHAYNKTNETRLMVGTDSHGVGKAFHFVTVIGVWHVGKGGTYFHKSSYEPRNRFKTQQYRLLEEVTKSLTVALDIENEVGVKPEVHIDASPPTSAEFSATFSENLRGYVLSSGYDAILKPDSFCANSIADKYTRKNTKDS